MTEACNIAILAERWIAAVSYPHNHKRKGVWRAPSRPRPAFTRWALLYECHFYVQESVKARSSRCSSTLPTQHNSISKPQGSCMGSGLHCHEFPSISVRCLAICTTFKVVGAQGHSTSLRRLADQSQSERSQHYLSTFFSPLQGGSNARNKSIPLF